MSMTVILICILLLFVFQIVSGHYVSTALLSIGVLGIWLLVNFNSVKSFMILVPYTQAASYALSTVPMYILMAQFIMKAGIIRDLYDLIYKLAHGRRGALGVMTIILGAFLGAVSGSGTATATALSQITYPELCKRGYSPTLSGAVCASAGSLSAIIPPSITILIYAIIAETSIAQLFEAALIPGILLTLCFIFVTLYFLGREKQNAKAQSEQSDGRTENNGVVQYVISLGGGALIILSIFGGIFSGLFTPTEAGAVGCFIAFVVALISRKMNVKFFFDALSSATATTAMSMLLCMCSGVFAKFASLSLLTRKVIAMMEPLIERPMMLILVVGVFYFIMFMLMDGFSPILMTVPFILPVVLAAGFSSVWFGIFLTLSAVVGFMTPPVGLVTYAVSAVTRVSCAQLFRKTLVYSIVGIVVVGTIITLFPQVVLWLPTILS